MSIEKQINIECIEAFANRMVYVRTEIAMVEDGKKIATSSVRYGIAPGDDYSQENDYVKAICSAIHTPEVVAQYQAQQEANKPQV